ncbi:MAG: type II toxin-antitoxin system PemK/MazF family toxin [Deltaproteobacteria bacterium]|nr:type II toxin-antitoxin system PemK/MazF family toxin [Deltaproteobacteria bacterium]
MKRNEIWLVNLDPTIGAEIRKTRPCVIISNDAVGVLPLKVIAPLTDFKERYRAVPWMVVVEPDADNNLTKPSVVDLFQVRCLSEERLIRKTGKLSIQPQISMSKALKVVFGLS